MQHHELVAKPPRARDVVCDHDDGRSAFLFQLEQQRVDLVGRNRIEAGARLVDEQDRRIERQRARETRALPHAARQRRGHLVVLPFEPDGRQLLLRTASDLRVGERACGVASGNATFSPTEIESKSAAF